MFYISDNDLLGNILITCRQGSKEPFQINYKITDSLTISGYTVAFWVFPTGDGFIWINRWLLLGKGSRFTTKKMQWISKKHISRHRIQSCMYACLPSTPKLLSGS